MRFFDNKIFTNSGDKERIIYSPIVNDDGTIDLVESGKENIQDYINSFFNEVDIGTLIKRFTAGEIDVFNRGNPFFADTTIMPKTYRDFLQLHIDAKNVFDRLPVSVKEKFDNDVNKYFVSIGTEEWNLKMKPILDKYTEMDSGKEEVKDNE